VIKEEEETNIEGDKKEKERGRECREGERKG
jgi:hypothetical protein